MKDSKPVTIAIFVGVLLIVVFIVGLVCDVNPAAFRVKYRYDFALEQFCDFCTRFWLPAGIIGIPTFLVSMFISLTRSRQDE